MFADVVCLDEPTSSLDLKGFETFLNALGEIENSVIIATNDRTLLKSLEGADVYRLEGGRLEKHG